MGKNTQQNCFQSRMTITATENIFYVKENNFPLFQKLMIYSQVDCLLFSALLPDKLSADAMKLNCCDLTE